MKGNRIGADGAEALAVALKQNGSLTALDLRVCLQWGERSGPRY